MNTELIDRLQVPMNDLINLCRTHSVSELSLFGSVVRGEHTTSSDVDLLVEFRSDARIGFLELAGLSADLSDLLRRPVDLVPKRGLKPIIMQQVLGEARVIYTE